MERSWKHMKKDLFGHNHRPYEVRYNILKSLSVKKCFESFIYLCFVNWKSEMLSSFSIIYQIAWTHQKKATSALLTIWVQWWLWHPQRFILLRVCITALWGKRHLGIKASKKGDEVYSIRVTQISAVRQNQKSCIRPTEGTLALLQQRECLFELFPGKYAENDQVITRMPFGSDMESWGGRGLLSEVLEACKVFLFSQSISLVGMWFWKTLKAL